MTFSPLKKFYPTADELLAADQESFDETILRHLKTYEGGRTIHQQSGFNRGYYIQAMEGTVRSLGPLPTAAEYGAQQPEVSSRVQEAWHRLMNKGYLMPNPDQHQGWFLITREGEKLLSHRALIERLEALGLDHVKQGLVNGFFSSAESGQVSDWIKIKQGLAVLPPKKGTKLQASTFLAGSRIDELRKLSSPDFDLQKLVRLCEELNSSYENGNYCATAMVTRAILDHVPPIFAHNKFIEVANNYSGWGKSFKETMQHLESASRKISDALLHMPIRKSETLPTPQQVWCGQQLDVLLGEIVRIMK